MATIIAHMVGSMTYLVGIVLLSNTVKQVYINEILFQSGITTKGRIIAKTKQPSIYGCGDITKSNKLQRHYLIIEYVIHSAQSLICNIKLKVSSNLYQQHSINDYIAIIYAKQDNKYYHSIKSQMDAQLKAITLYSNIALSMIIISIYPFMYFLSGHFVLIPLSIFVVLCVIALPHHLHSCELTMTGTNNHKSHCIKRMANRDDLRSFGIDYKVDMEDNYYMDKYAAVYPDIYGFEDEEEEEEEDAEAIDADNSNSMTSDVDIDRESSQTTSAHTHTPMRNGNRNMNDSPSIQITTSNSMDRSGNGQDHEPIINRPQETIAILYESYVETPTVEENIDTGNENDKDEFVMVFN